MKFGPASPKDAIGGVTVHTLRQGALVLKKGTTIGAAEVEALEKAGVKEIVVVRLEQGDVSEDVAAAGIAQAVAGDGVNVERAFTGRSNLFAARAGVLVVDRAAVDRINGIDEAITLATLPAFKPVVEGEMIATVKLIPFGVEGKLRDAAVAVAGKDTLRVAPYVISKVGVVSTQLPGLAPKVIDKTLRVTAERLAPAGATIIAERRVPHDETVLAASIKELLGLGAELVIVFGASAIADRRDVIPAAITDIGGAIEHFGMPVDPGNLLLIGSAGGVPVLGAPGCARSPVENGFDWVLMRLLARLKVTRADLTGMGVGGLLMEIVTRGQPRSVPDIEGNRNVSAIVLAAGRSTRMGGPNKLLAELNGNKLVRIVVEQALASKATEVIVVTGHQAELVEQGTIARSLAKFTADGYLYRGKKPGSQEGYARTYSTQPPLIPHAVENFDEVTLTENQCLECHGPENYKRKESPPLGEKHFVAGSKTQFAQGRYACVMCHVPQSDAKPLVENEFRGDRLVPAAQRK